MSSPALLETRSTTPSIWDEFVYDDGENEDHELLPTPLARLHAVDDSREAVDTPESQPPSSDELRTRFEVLATELAEGTRVLSSTRRAMKHPAYDEILTLGTQVIPYVVERLRDELDRPVWLRMLGSLTTGQPNAGQETIEAATAEWLTRAKRDGLV